MRPSPTSLSALLAACLLLPVAARALTLAEAQDRLFRDNPDLAVLRLESDRAASQVTESKAAWLPSLDALGSYSVTTETGRLRLDLPFPPPGGTSVNRTLGDNDRVEAGLDATIPLFTGFSRGHTVEARLAQARAREAQVLAARNQLSLRLASLFYAWQLARAQAVLLGEVAAHARGMRDQLEAFVKAGTAVRSRALAAEARARSAEVDRLAAESARDSLALEVRDFLGRPDEASSAAAAVDSLAPDTTLPEAAPWEGPEVDGTGGGGGLRPEDRVLEEGMLQARAGARALAGQRFPQVMGMAGVRYGNPGLNLMEDEFMAYGLAGLQLRWNLFDGARNRQQRLQLEIQERILAQQLRKQDGERRKSMEGARLRHARWTAQLEAARAAREAARAAADDLARQLELGLATEVELLEARSQEARAAWIEEQARAMRRLAVLQWRHAAGKELRF